MNYTTEYDFRKTEEVKEYIEILMLRFMSYYQYWTTLDDLLEIFDAKMYCFDTDSYRSAFNFDIEGDDEASEAFTNLRTTTLNFSNLTDSSIRKVLTEIIKVIKNDNKEKKIAILGKDYVWDGTIEELENIFLESINEYIGGFHKESCIRGFKECLDDCVGTGTDMD